MKAYSKGSRAERELIKMFLEKGFYVVRAAGSGNEVTPDLLVFRKGKQYCFECKAWDRTSLHVPREQVENLMRWEEVTGITTMVAWRISRTGWRFIPVNVMIEKDKSYAVSLEKALNMFTFEDISKV